MRGQARHQHQIVRQWLAVSGNDAVFWLPQSLCTAIEAEAGHGGVTDRDPGLGGESINRGGIDDMPEAWVHAFELPALPLSDLNHQFARNGAITARTSPASAAVVAAIAVADIEQWADAIALPAAFSCRKPGGVEYGMTEMEAVSLICRQCSPGGWSAAIGLYAQPAGS